MVGLRVAAIKLLCLFGLVAGITSHSCLQPTPYFQATSGSCYADCPWESPTKYYKYEPTFTCQETCPDPYYGFDGSKSCTTTCPNQPSQTYYDSRNKKCVEECPANYFGYLGSDSTNNQKCVQNCPSPTYADFESSLCVETCPADTKYMNGTRPYCTTRCPENFYASPIDKECKMGGSCPTSPVKYYADDTTNQCVEQCPDNYFADQTTGRCLVFCSSGYFADQSTGTGVCVQTCPDNLYRDSVVRKCVTRCSTGTYADRTSTDCQSECPADTFGDDSTGFCEDECRYPAYGDPRIRLCVETCSFNSYADNNTHHCVDPLDCYGNTVGDPTTLQCVNISSCPSQPYYFGDLVSKLCVPKCSTSLWGDRVTKTCLSECPWNPGTYLSWKNPDIQECVTRCPENPSLYADNVSRTCVSTCPQQSSPSVPFDTFADSVSQTCVETCPNGFYSQSSERICVSECSTTPTVLYYYAINQSCIDECPEDYYADISKQICTSVCPSIPDYYGHGVTNKCVAQCPQGYFSDSHSRECVEACPQVLRQYGDVSTNKCVDECPMQPDLYGQDRNDGNKTCVDVCQDGTFADPMTRKCVSKCNTTQGYYGQTNKRCVLECTTGFQDTESGTCVPTCPRLPQYYYGNPTNKKCVLSCPQYLYANRLTNMCVEPSACPSSHYADDFSNFCVELCPQLQGTFGQSSSRRCVKSCPQGQFADNTTRLCSTTCNATANLFKDPSSKACVYVCPSTPALWADPNTKICQERCQNDYFAYDLQRKCVSICPSFPAYFGDYQTYRCVEQCPRETYKFYNNTFRGCVNSCPQLEYTALNIIDLYSDNSSWSCVSLCPRSQNLYNFKHPTDTTDRRCVHTCPKVGAVFYFSENTTQSCVTACPTPKFHTYGDIFTLKCEQNCTLNQYRDNLTKKCTYMCSQGYFADNSTWDCVRQCPDGTFGDNINNTCVRQCPIGYYAEDITRICRTDCDNQQYWYADNTSAKCIRECPRVPNLFANPLTRKCDYVCTGGKYADNNTGTCVQPEECTNGQIAEQLTWRCVIKCPIQVPSFLNNDTNLCVTMCSVGYADNSTMICVSVCPSDPDYYGYNDTLLGKICVLYCPDGLYRHSETRLCIDLCPSPLYRDPTTMSCVQVCLDHYYAEESNRICVEDCGSSNKFALRESSICVENCPDGYYADSTTNQCVKDCPFGYFGEGHDCVVNCTNDYANPITKLCEQVCSAGYYSKLPERICVKYCGPDYAFEDSQSCINECPTSSNISQNWFHEDNSFRCVKECLRGWYGNNSTRKCEQACSSVLFADNSTRLCVDICPDTPDTYGYNGVCYYPCPASTLFAENSTRNCVLQCPDGSFADATQGRCMNECSGTLYAWDDPNSLDNLCMNMCPQDFYATDFNKSCVHICLNDTYGQSVTNVCVKECPTGQYADSLLKVCVQQCSEHRNEYADPSSNQCTQNCPSVPSLYAQDNMRICVIACEADWFRLNTTRVCTQDCPQPFFADPNTGYCAYSCSVNHNLYADNQTRRCQLTCPNVSVGGDTGVITYADDSTKRCVFTCPIYPPLYGQNSTNRCESACLPGTFGDNQTRVCHQTCFFGVSAGPNFAPKYTYADDTTNFCVQICPRNSYGDNETVTCTSQCTIGSYADDSTWMCVVVCPVNPLSFASQTLKKCVYECENGTFGDEDGRICANSCRTEPFYSYRDYQNHRCALNCTSPYFADKFTQSCAENCQFGYFKNLAEHTCQQCPESCISCVAELDCTSCQPDLYMYEGECIVSCPTFPVRLFANDLASTCVEQCELPYFGFQGTGKCEIECPETFYSDLETGTCKACPEGCRYCLSTNCSSCLQNYIYAQDYEICSKVCNSTHIYYSNGNCTEGCVDNTFLLSDLVTCQSCSIECLSCSRIGTNCTRCASKFWYNYLCVEKCPDNYYVSSDQRCQYCGDNNENCLLEPLSYEITTYNKNYQLFAQVQFNRAVNLTKQSFTEYVKISTANGAIKPSNFIATKTSETVYTVMFLNSNSLNEMSIFIGFAPGFIVDAYGNTLVKTQEEVVVQTVTAVSTQTERQVAEATSGVNVLSWILVVVVLMMMIKYSYPLILLVDTLQTMYMHIYLLVVPLPYLWFNINSVLTYFHFTFLPQVHTDNQLPVSQYSNFQADTTFLGNMHPFVFFISIYLGFYLIVWILTFPVINRSQWFRKKVKKLYRKRMRYSFIFEAFYYPAFYTLFFAIYQLKGHNDGLASSNLNKGLAITVLIVYVAMFCVLLYVSAKTRDKISQVAACIRAKKSLPKMPTKFDFLIIEPSKFPMEMAIRIFIKLCICIALQIENITVQVILMIAFNIIFLCYIIIFKPSLLKVTNRLNIFLSLGFITIELVLFIYMLSDKSSEQQQLTSIAGICVQGVMLLVLLAWCIYRFVHWVREKFMKIESNAEMDVEPIKNKHSRLPQESNLQLMTSPSRKKARKIKKGSKVHPQQTQKQITLSQLNQQDEDEQEDETINADNLIEEFAYHFVPAKTSGMIEEENKMLGITDKKRKSAIVLEIDEDDLVSNQQRQEPARLGPKIQRNNALQIQQLGLDSPSSRAGSNRKLNPSHISDENEIIWDQLAPSDQNRSRE